MPFFEVVAGAADHEGAAGERFAIEFWLRHRPGHCGAIRGGLIGVWREGGKEVEEVVVCEG